VPGFVLGLLGAVGVVMSIFLPWRTGAVHASDIPVEFLWNRNATGSPSLLIVLIPLALMLAVATFVPFGARGRRIGSAGTLIVVALFAYQLHRVVDATGGGLVDALDAGFYFAAIGAVLALVSAWGRRL
jgi:hypothetical protein